MKQPFFIYLAGNIRKGKEDDKEDIWTEKEMQYIQQLLPQLEIHFLNPHERNDDLSDQKSVFGRDLFQVFSSDLVLVDARGKRGLGVGSEMMFAKMHSIPVAAWVPKPSHYQRENLHMMGQLIPKWVHPFVENLSDFIGPSLEEICRWIGEDVTRSNIEVKGPECTTSAITYYLETQLERDRGVHEIVQANRSHFDEKLHLLEEAISTY